ncbi:hypothetical protein GCM10011410_07740 [Hoyosella rhizosphaerae]|uniref:SRPBCC family protein n=2 Tax=Hoyosella rhizosphaerae TaxID=1755582 RepID=A0A916XB27_9ACTN|nr:hypothetical protein GCM10011410_07740 [Hoyosella rhizosphaerae]
MTTEIPIEPAVAWARACDFAGYDQWFTLHGGWCSEVPARIVHGSTAVSEVVVRGLRQKVSWTALRVEEPHLLTLEGRGMMGINVVVDLAVTPTEMGSRVALDFDITGAAVAGPIGFAVAKSLKGDIRKSLELFTHLGQ